MFLASPITYLVFAISFVAADRDCCYWFANNPNTQQFQVSWNSSTQTPSCSFITYGSQWSSQCTANTTSIDGQYLAVTAIMSPSGGPQFNITFGMNNNACKYLHNDQAQAIFGPVGWGGSGTDWSNHGSWNVDRDTQCSGNIIS